MSPVFTSSFFTVPAAGLGISRDALSDSSTRMVCSASTVSPSLTDSSMISASSMSPRSGAGTVCSRAGPLPPDPLPSDSLSPDPLPSDPLSSGSLSSCSLSVDALSSESPSSEAWSSAPASVSSSNRGSPSLTRSPAFTSSSRTVPAFGHGTSTDALSDSNTTMVSSASTLSPFLTDTSMTSTGSLLPTSGTRMVSLLMAGSL